MKINKCIYLIFAFTFIFILHFVNINADTNYLNYNDYTSTLVGNNRFNAFLSECKAEGKDAYFDGNVIILNNNSEILLPQNVSLIGNKDNMPVIKCNTNNILLLFDRNQTNNFNIQNIIFDNVGIIKDSGSLANAADSSLNISNCIFLNGKEVESKYLSKLGIKKGDMGYYILSKYEQTSITSNIFLRDEKSKGRGVTLYNTMNDKVLDNYFGIIDPFRINELSKDIINLSNILNDKYNLAYDQGYFMTCINGSLIENTSIGSNYFNPNKEVSETSDGLQDTAYNRDHIIYLHHFNFLNIYNNIFEGMPKNKDGGIKIRDGKNLNFCGNNIIDSIMLLYVQDDNSYLENIYIADNTFINKKNENNNKFNYLIFFQNYYEVSSMSNLTIINNKAINANGENNSNIYFYYSNYNNTFANVLIKNNDNMKYLEAGTINSSNVSSGNYMPANTYQIREYSNIHLLYQKATINGKTLYRFICRFDDINENDYHISYTYNDKENEILHYYTSVGGKNGVMMQDFTKYFVFTLEELKEKDSIFVTAVKDGEKYTSNNILIK